jgi:hypothetical protein
MAGFGMLQPEQTRDLTSKIIPYKCHLVKEKIKLIIAEKNLVITEKEH